MLKFILIKLRFPVLASNYDFNLSTELLIF